MYWKYLSVFGVAVLLIFFFVFAKENVGNKDYGSARDEIVIRKIGHEILLQSGDRSSRVLPVKRLKKNEYQLQFESQFTIIPDSLVNIINQLVTDNKLPTEYIVNLIDCSSNEIIFGYSNSTENSVVPCIGRELPESCYFINIKFGEPRMSGLEKKYLIGGLGLGGLTLIFLGLKVYSQRKQMVNIEKTASPGNEQGVLIGKYLFNYEQQFLLFGNTEKTDLTIKEAKLLNIFAANPNQVIDRSRLQKEVWEDEGVIVGRSLDMFISRLRKKFEKDPLVKIVNIHGKGYRLDIGQE